VILVGGRQFKFTVGVSAALLTSAACTASPSIQTEIAVLEASAIMPDGAAPLDSYARFYSVLPNSIEGTFVHSDMLGHVLDRRVVQRRLAPNVFLVDPANLPIIMDGGCGVLTLQYDRQRRERVRPVCNGMA
jgi:hypothetical protein